MLLDRQETGDVSTVTVAVNNETQALSVPVALTEAGNNELAFPSLMQSASPVFTPHFYQKLGTSDGSGSQHFVR
jgi:hypothetical protein